MTNDVVNRSADVARETASGPAPAARQGAESDVLIVNHDSERDAGHPAIGRRPDGSGIVPVGREGVPGCGTSRGELSNGRLPSPSVTCGTIGALIAHVSLRRRAWAASVLLFVTVPQAEPSSQVPSSPGGIYQEWCAPCHAADGTGRVVVPTVTTPPPDFTDCAFATSEPDSDWELVTAQGGPPAGMSSQMPAYGEALDANQIRGVVAHLRTFCREPGWPSGNLNFPRPIFTEKAFPENEVVILPAVSHRNGEPVGFRLRSVYERRFGRRGHGEIGVPLESVGANGRATGLSDISLAAKYVLHTNRAATSILTGGLEVTVPTGSERRALGAGTAVIEPYLASGLALGLTVVQAQLKYEFPARDLWDDREIVYNVYLGHSLDIRPATWTLGVELNGVQEDVALTPQARKALTRTGALAAAVGVRIPVINRSDQPVRYVGYLLWEYLDPVRPRP